MKHAWFRGPLWRVSVVALCCLLAAGAADAQKAKKKKAAAPKKPAQEEAAPHPSTLPWVIRAQYGITYGDLELKYSSDNAEWTLVKGGKETLIDNVGMALTLADGTVVNFVESSKGKTNYEDNSDGFGAFRRFWMETAPNRGIVLRHGLYRYKERPFMLLRSEIVNAGDKPIEIRQVATAVLGGKGMALAPETTVAQRAAGRRGAYVVYDPAAPSLDYFTDPAHALLLGFGAFPEQPAPATVAFEQKDGAWHGRIACDYAPGRVLKPGESLKVTPVWLTFYVPKAVEMDTAYAAALAALPKPAAPAPAAWVTVAPEQPAEALLAAAEAWAGSGVKHALVPAPWTGSDDYSYNARGAASTLKGAKMTPGIAVDLLGLQGVPENLGVAGADGRRWLNPALPEARDFVAKPLAQLADWGYGFVVVAPSAVPDDVLRQLGLSRAEADALALDLAASAAGKLPVVPAPTATLGNAIDDWLKAAASTSRARNLGAAVGPVRVDIGGLGEPSDGLAAAMALYNGPIEIVGTPAGGLPRRVKSLFPRPVTYARAMDAAAPVPKLWQTQEALHRGSPVHVVLAFPGAPAWKEADLEAGFEGKVKALQVGEDGSIGEAKR